MELRQYWDILVDRAAVVLITFVVAAAVAATMVFAFPQVGGSYQASLSFAVKPAPLQTSPPYYYPANYYDYVASEYANDDLIWVVETPEFMNGLKGQFQGRPGGMPSGSIKGEKAHRVVKLTITAASADGAMSLARAVGSALAAPDAGQKYFSSFTNRPQSISLIQPPQLVSQPAGRNLILNLAVRSLVGLFLGVGLAFLLEYLDTTVRANEVEELLGWRVLGEIPGRGLPQLAPAPARPSALVRGTVTE